MADRTDPRPIAVAAGTFVARYGARAAAEAALRERELAEAGRLAGMTRWRLIRKRIEAFGEAPELKLVRGGRSAFDAHGDAHAAADAQSRQSAFRAAPLHLVK